MKKKAVQKQIHKICLSPSVPATEEKFHIISNFQDEYLRLLFFNQDAYVSREKLEWEMVRFLLEHAEDFKASPS